MASAPPNTGLTIFGGQGAALPAHIAQFFDEAGTNIAPRTTVPSLSPEGKTWTISLNGQKTKLQRRNTDGDLEPLPIMKAVVLDYAKQRGRAYYEGEYDPNNVSAPVCWSDDGVAPDVSLPGPFAAGTAVEPGSSRKISAACANCPMAVKGSKVTPQGKAVTACSQHRMLAVVPDPALGLKDIPPLRLKIAMTSDWDKQSPDQEAQGWLAWSNYVDWLVARNCKHTAAIVTKMKFDPDAAYPKVFFSAERPLDPAELAIIAPLSKSDEVKKLLGGTWTPAGVDGVPKEQQKVAGAEPATDQLSVPQDETKYVMKEGESFTEEQYISSGWTREQLVNAGKLVAVVPAAPAPAPTPAPPPAPPPAAVAPQPEAGLVVGEDAAAGVVLTTAAPAAVSPPAAEAAIVLETTAAEKPAAPPPAQQPALAEVAAPAPPPAKPEPPAAAAAAAAAATPASTDVPEDVASLLNEWA